MLKAGSFLYSIFIALIISSVASSFILYHYYQNKRVAQYQGRLQAISRVESGLNWLKASQEDQFKADIPLFEGDLQTTKLQLQQWGGYYLATAQSNFRQSNFQQAALLGYPNKAPYALYLADNNQPLSLSGDARIIGEAFLPKRGIKRAYIEGRSYTGSNLLAGNQELSAGKLPVLSERLRTYMKRSLQAGIPDVADKVLSLDGDYQQVNQSFHDSTLCYYAIGEINLEADSLRGRIIVKSDQSIYVGNQAYLEQVVLIAPKVVIAAGNKGSFHIIASDSVIVGALTELNYPSSILLQTNGTDKAIVIEEGAKIEGEVLLDGEDSFKNKALIHLEKNAEVHGNLYSYDRISLEGKVIGSVSCNKFLLKTSSSIYENHILNGVVNAKELHTSYLGAVRENSAAVKKVVKWLN